QDAQRPGERRRQARWWGRLQDFLRHAPAEHQGGILFRSHLRRQQGYGSVENDRLSGRSLQLQRLGHPARRTSAVSDRWIQRTPRLEGRLMATTLKPVDVVLVGFGWTGAIMAQQFCDAGMDVLALERGPWRDTSTDFATGFAQDELRYMWRHHLFQNLSDETLTIRNNTGQQALPMRHLGSFLLGPGVGSGGVHWNAQIWRFLPSDLSAYSHILARYGNSLVTAHDMS